MHTQTHAGMSRKSRRAGGEQVCSLHGLAGRCSAQSLIFRLVCLLFTQVLRGLKEVMSCGRGEGCEARGGEEVLVPWGVFKRRRMGTGGAREEGEEAQRESIHRGEAGQEGFETMVESQGRGVSQTGTRG